MEAAEKYVIVNVDIATLNRLQLAVSIRVTGRRRMLALALKLNTAPLVHSACICHPVRLLTHLF